MMSEEELKRWLEFKNEQFRANDILPKQRPFLALRDLAKEKKVAIQFGSPIADKVFEWFKANTKPGSHVIGPFFKGIYYFDACFWPVHIPVGYGQFKLKALDSLETMPETLREQLQNNQRELWTYMLYWVDCIDFSLGSEDLRRETTLPTLGKQFLDNGEREIEGVISQLSEPRPNSKAILGARMAVEIYLKSLLIIKGNAAEPVLKKIGHDLGRAMDECVAIASAKEFAVLRPMLSIFPDVSARYTLKEENIRKTWESYGIAQAVATTVIRILTGRDTRPQLAHGRQT